jgi:hypothetical protein
LNTDFKTNQQSPEAGSMTKVTTTKATHRGFTITVIAENNGHGTTYSCRNDSKRQKTTVEWFSTQGEAIANERRELDGMMP